MSPMHYMLLGLTNRRKEIVAFTALDPEDYAWASQSRWCRDSHGYALHRVQGSEPLMHREILRPTSGLEVDHMDGNPLNNRRCNLRVCTHAENHQNKGGRKRGVTYDPNRRRWVAKHKLNGKTHNLGRFLTEQEALDAAARFRVEHMPFATEGR